MDMVTETDKAITKAQIAKIWASANDLGLDREMLYLMVPRGSISSLTQVEAAELIERLYSLGARREGAAPRQYNPNAATAEQRNFIHFLFGKLGWLEQPSRIQGFLRKFAGVNTVEEIRQKQRASAIIEALKAMYKRRRKTIGAK